MSDHLSKQPTRRPHPAPHATRPPQPAAAATTGDGYDDQIHEGGIGLSRFFVFAAVPSWMTSMLFHIALLFVLALITISAAEEYNATVVMNQKPEEVIEPEVPEIDIPEMPDTTDFIENPTPDSPDEPDLSDDFVDIPSPDSSDDPAPPVMLLNPLSITTCNIGDWSDGFPDGTGIKGRPDITGKGPFGVPRPVIDATVNGLKWIAAHQNSDGTWSFDHTTGLCNGRCGNPGSADAAVSGATALALLPFLGAGQTHLKGKFTDTVDRGLAALIRRMGAGGKKGSWWESDGRMYSHGLAAIALCEAYAMTNDERLLPAAQASIKFIEYAQDPIGGGWRYNIKEKGDTSVVGWQLMALKSAHQAYLAVDMNCPKKANLFLDSVQTDSGSKYGYTSPGRGDATTAIGLLCRMYSGWEKSNPALQRGIAFLDQRGPSTNNMYYNYYATQVMFQYDGDEWKRWDKRMLPLLLSTQSKKGTGHEEGSWYFNGGHGGRRGGRLYSTCMAAMTLEVYYRIMSVYQKKGHDFEL